jgi:hypothetical protein
MLSEGAHEGMEVRILLSSTTARADIGRCEYYEVTKGPSVSLTAFLIRYS